LQSVHSGAAQELGHRRHGRHQVGYGSLPAGRLSDLLLFPVEGHLHLGQGGVVHCAFPVRGAARAADQGRDAARRLSGHQILPATQFQRHHQTRGVGGRSHSGLFLARTWIWCAARLRLLQQVPQQRLSVRLFIIAYACDGCDLLDWTQKS
jgi:hypothetical protein